MAVAVIFFLSLFHEVQQAFESGDFVTKETASTFNQIPDDQALEHVKKSGKIAGGLV